MAGAIQRVGQWATANSVLGTSVLKIDKAIDIALRREAELFRAGVVKGIAAQAPGGKKFKPIADTTKAMRRFRNFKGNKALIVRGDLRRSIKVVKAAGGYFVGVLRSARSSVGRGLINIAAVQEFGATIVIRLTPKMRKFLAMVFRQAGLPEPASRSGPTIVIKIPPRPFLQPVADKLRPGAGDRVIASVNAVMKLTG